MAALPRAHLAYFPADVTNVLVVASALLDATSTAGALRAMHAREALRIHVLAIEPRPTGYARTFLGQVDVEGIQDARAHQHAQPLCDALDAAGIPFRMHVVAGGWLDSIEHHARELGCTLIVVGDNPHHWLRRLVLRHDRWRIGSFLRGQGLGCRVEAVSS